MTSNSTARQEKACRESDVVYRPIGVVLNSSNEPGLPKSIRNSESVLVLDEIWSEALEGLEKFKHILVIYHIDRSPGYVARVHPMGDLSIPKRGVLATRSPSRPNPIGVTVAEVLSIEGTRIKVTGLDALNGTPILDIKPYEEHFDSPQGLEKERDAQYRPRDIDCVG
jgi:tRNA-Thr(GGU) m(6)t(6)A37 methyltransferase TsaA